MKKKSIKKYIAGVLCFNMAMMTIPPTYVKAEIIPQMRSLVFTDYEPVINAVVNEKSNFAHPSIGVSSEELENVRSQIKKGAEPWNSYLEGLLKTNAASKNYNIKNQSSSNPDKSKYSYKDYTSAFMENTIQVDGMAAYTQALLYYFTGDEEYREKSIKILRLWSQLDPSEAGGVADGHIKMSGAMYYMVSAAELLKYTSCENEDLIWTEEDNEKFINNFIKPPLKYYLANANVVNAWMNQFSYPLAARIAADIFMDNIEDYNIAVEMAAVNKNAKDAGVNGSISRIFRRAADDKLTEGLDDTVIQLAEMGRDQPHAAGNITCLTTIAYMIENQGTRIDPVSGEPSESDNAVSIFNFLDNRLLRGANYFIKYNLGYETEWYPIAYGASMKDGEISNVYCTYDIIYDQGRGRFYNFDVLYYRYMNDSSSMSLMNEERGGKYLAEFHNNRPAPESGLYSGEEGGVDFWIHIPMSEEDSPASTKKAVGSYEAEDRYTLLSGSAACESNENSSYVKLNADEEGTFIALRNVPTQRDRSGYSTINLKIKTNSNSTFELRRDNNSEPFKTVILPDTNDEWTEVSLNMNVSEVSYAQYSQDIQILFLNVKGTEGDYVCIDNLRVSPRDNYAPVFENSAVEKQVNSYVGSRISTYFEASDNDKLTYTMIDGPEGAVLNPETGEFTWIPENEGMYTFYVQANDGNATSILKVNMNISNDIRNVVNEIMKGYDSKESYVSYSKNDFIEAYDYVMELIENNETDAEILSEAIINLEKAVENLKLLTPLLSDGTMDYSNMVTSSLNDSMERNLLDGDTETFTGDLFSPNNYFTLDFGKDFTITADGFKIQSRKYFSERIWRAVVYGSNDFQNWTALTDTIVGNTAEMVDMPVIEEHRNKKFRYLKIGSEASCFNPSEFRISGVCHETTNKIKSVSIKSDADDCKRALEGDKVILTFKTNEKIDNINVVIADQDAEVTYEGNNTYKAEIILDEVIEPGNASFNIEYETLNGEQGMTAYETTDDSSVLLSDESNMLDLLDGSVDFIDSNGKNSINALKQTSYLFDNNINSASDYRLNGNGAGGYITFDFRDKGAELSRVEILARQDAYYTRIGGLVILASNDGEKWTQISSDTGSITKNWQALYIDNKKAYRYIKITNPNAWFGNMAELRLFGEVSDICDEDDDDIDIDNNVDSDKDDVLNNESVQDTVKPEDEGDSDNSEDELKNPQGDENLEENTKPDDNSNVEDDKNNSDGNGSTNSDNSSSSTTSKKKRRKKRKESLETEGSASENSDELSSQDESNSNKDGINGDLSNKDNIVELISQDNADNDLNISLGDAEKVTSTWVMENNKWYYLDEAGSKKNGWFKDSNGKWYYLDKEGAMITGWHMSDDSKWYFMNTSGEMMTGWQNIGGRWYYLKEEGSMYSGWFKDTDGKWYFFNSDGSMAYETYIDGYYLGSNGAWIK